MTSYPHTNLDAVFAFILNYRSVWGRVPEYKIRDNFPESTYNEVGRACIKLCEDGKIVRADYNEDARYSSRLIHAWKVV